MGNLARVCVACALLTFSIACENPNSSDGDVGAAVEPADAADAGTDASGDSDAPADVRGDSSVDSDSSVDEPDVGDASGIDADPDDSGSPSDVAADGPDGSDSGPDDAVDTPDSDDETSDTDVLGDVSPDGDEDGDASPDGDEDGDVSPDVDEDGDVSPDVDEDGDGATDTDTSDAPRCGDGVVDPGEACDDGNTDPADGCEADCTPTPCPDTDADGVCDDDDDCPLDPDDDADFDGVCGDVDRCPGGDDRADSDTDGVPDACDVCSLGPDADDASGDGTPDACDRCFGSDDGLDVDLDGIPDACDCDFERVRQCGVHSTCEDGRDGITCRCESGYEAVESMLCVDIDECAADNGGCDALTECINVPGTVVCGSCPVGYSGSGEVGCTDIDECAAGTGVCPESRWCNNTPGSYHCTFCELGCEVCEAPGVVAGHYATCSVSSAGTLFCWGSGTDAGDEPGGMGDSLVPIDFGPGRSVIDFDVGSGGVCVVLDDGTVRLTGTSGSAVTEVELGEGRRAVDVSCLHYHGCAVLDDGAIRCWGTGWHGGLGAGDLLPRSAWPGATDDSPTDVLLPADDHAIGVRTGSSFTCALLATGAIKCWGWNEFGVLGVGGGFGTVPLPPVRGIDFGSGRSAVALDVGFDHSCALLDDGTVKCWGVDSCGSLGTGLMEVTGHPWLSGDAWPAVDLGTGVSVRAVSAGAYQTCALLDDGRVKCWGCFGDPVSVDWLFWVRGQGKTAESLGDALAPVDFGTGRNSVGISVGSEHACALLDDGTLKCWGANYSGELGLGDTLGRPQYHRTASLPLVPALGDALPAVDLGSRDVACFDSP